MQIIIEITTDETSSDLKTTIDSEGIAANRTESLFAEALMILIDEYLREVKPEKLRTVVGAKKIQICYNARHR